MKLLGGGRGPWHYLELGWQRVTGFFFGHLRGNGQKLAVTSKDLGDNNQPCAQIFVIVLFPVLEPMEYL